MKLSRNYIKNYQFEVVIIISYPVTLKQYEMCRTLLHYDYKFYLILLPILYTLP